MVSSILCLCICTCICVLSLLPGILALLKLLFYVHQLIVRVAGFQNCCFYSFPPPHQLLVAFCVTKGFLKGCALTVEFRTATCILFLQQVPVSSIWKGGGKKIDEKRCFDECVYLTSIASLGKSWVKEISEVRPGRESMKRYFTPKPNIDFLHERGQVGETHHIRSWPI